MDKYIWRLLTAMFLLLVAAVLGVFAFVFQGVVLLVGICVYGGTILALVGIAQGVLVLIDYHREHKDEE